MATFCEQNQNQQSAERLSDLAVLPPVTNCCLANFNRWPLIVENKSSVRPTFSKPEKVHPIMLQLQSLFRSQNQIMIHGCQIAHRCTTQLTFKPYSSHDRTPATCVSKVILYVIVSGQNYPTKRSQFDDPRSEILNLTNLNEGWMHDSLKVTSEIGVGSHTGV